MTTTDPSANPYPTRGDLADRKIVLELSLVEAFDLRLACIDRMCAELDCARQATRDGNHDQAKINMAEAQRAGDLRRKIINRMAAERRAVLGTD
jgi:hypothetical protein